MKIRRMYQYRLYESPKQNKHLKKMIAVSSEIWNHALGLQRRYYRLYKKYIPVGKLKSHIKDLRMKTDKYAHWKSVNSQTVQDVLERLDRAYKKFFKKQAGLPRFKPRHKYKSFTLKTSGWGQKADKREPVPKKSGKGYHRGIGVIEVNGREYKYVKHRPLNPTAQVKTVTIKKDAAGRLWLFFSVVEAVQIEEEASTGHIGGFDFGLKTFLTADNGQQIDNPQFYKQDLPRFRKIQSRVSKKVKGSTNRREGKRHLARRHIRIADKRQDFHYQLAHELCDHYDGLIFEDLNIEGMKRLWGRKVSDLGFSQFVEIVQWIACKRGKHVILIDRWERTTGKCSTCGHEQDLELKDRTFSCTSCGLTLDRDHNAAINIRELGHQLMLSQSEEDPSGHPALTSEAQVF